MPSSLMRGAGSLKQQSRWLSMASCPPNRETAHVHRSEFHATAETEGYKLGGWAGGCTIRVHYPQTTRQGNARALCATAAVVSRCGGGGGSDRGSRSLPRAGQR